MSDRQSPFESTSSGVSRRKDQFATKIATKIWSETPTAENPYVAEAARCHGYDLMQLVEKCSYTDVVFLLCKGELPASAESQLFGSLFVAFVSPGPRHAATRAAMNAGVGKTDPAHILPISLAVFGGEHLGAGEIEPAMRWLRKNVKSDPAELAKALIAELEPGRDGDLHIVPGFGSRFGTTDRLIANIAQHLVSLPGAGPVMKWAQDFSRALACADMGWLSTGLAAAVLADLGFQPRFGAGIFQLMSAPGLFAHGIEMASKPLTAMPFPEDANYFIENKGGEKT